MTHQVFSTESFPTLVQSLLGLTVSRPWKGYGSTLFLELGQLKPTESLRGRTFEVGEASVWIEWDWRVERDVSILYGSSDTQPNIERNICGLAGLVVESISIAGKVPELTVNFNKGLSLRSMAMTTGDAQWIIRLQDGRYIETRAGELLVGDGKDIDCATEDEQQAFALAERVAQRWGTPIEEPKLGNCRDCVNYVRINGEGHLLDYGVCISSESPFDGKVVDCNSGCPVFISEEA